MNTRRSFLQKAGSLPLAFGLNSLFQEAHGQQLLAATERVKSKHALEVATDEDYWSVIQQGYTVDPNLINLNNGGVSPSPRVVQDAVDRYNRITNEGPSYYMWRIIDQGREPLRQKLADLAGCSPEEVAVNRNATEALNTVIYGLDFKPGDEVIGTKQDYPNMIQAWKQRQLRDGIVYKQINFEFPIEDDSAIVNMFEQAITPKTKLLHLTHIINWIGQILPVRKIADMAHAKGVEVLVDGAHSFGLLDFNIPDLHADYFGTSLHKFLSAPIGSGLLYIRKEKIEKVWPLLCNDKPRGTDIRKFETLGTRSFPIEQGIGEAVNFHLAIGKKRKEERIRYLKNYWAERVVKVPKVKIHTSFQSKYSCAICGVSIDGMTPQQLDTELFNKYKIHTVGISWENINCVRVTPHVYTRLQDLDKLVVAITELSKSTSG